MNVRRTFPSLLALTLAMVTGLLVSCDDLIYDSSSASAVGSQASSADAFEITFTVSTVSTTSTRADDESTSSTSSTYSDSYTSLDADTYEQTINTMQVYLYDSSDNYLLKVTQTRLVESSTGIYSYTGTLPIEDSSAWASAFTADSDGTYSFSGKIMVLANCNTYPAETVATAISLSDTGLSGMTYSVNTSSVYPLVPSTGIPMWGIATITNLDLQQGICAAVDDIYLIRAMAKITVDLDANTAALGYSITAVTLSGYNTTGLCLPAGYSTVSTTKGLNLECDNIPTSVSASTEGISLTNDDDTWTLYLPEMKTTSATITETSTTVYTTTPYLTVTIQTPNTGTTTSEDGTETTTNITTTKTLYLCEYTDGESTSSNYTLTRNHVYAYTLSTSELLVTSTVSNWEEQVSSVGWEVDDTNVTFIVAGWTADSSSSTWGDTDAYYSVLTYPRWGKGTDSDGNTIEASKHLAVIDSKSYASYEFTLSTDAQFETGTITWRAYLTNPDYFEFTTNTDSSDIDRTDYYQYNVTMGVNRGEQSYTLKVGPKGSRRWENVVTETTTTDGKTTTTTYLDTDIRWHTGVTDGAAYSGSTSGVSGTIIEGIRTYALSNASDYNNQYVSEGGDTIEAVYTDVFILAMGSGLVYPLNINPTYSGGIFTPNRFPGGTKDLGYVIPSDDPYYPNEHITLREHQWFRIYWTHANTISSQNGYGDILQMITDASDDDEKWYDPD